MVMTEQKTTKTTSAALHDQIKIAVIATGFDHTRQTLKEFVKPIEAAPKEDADADNQPKTTPQEIPQEKDDDNVWDIPAFLRQRN